MADSVNWSVRVGDIDKHQFVGSYFDVPITLLSDKPGDVTIEYVSAVFIVLLSADSKFDIFFW